MSNIRKLIQSMDFQKERRHTQEATGSVEWGSKPITIRIDAPSIYMLDQLAATYGITRSGMARDLIELAVMEAFTEAFGSTERVQVGPDEYEEQKVVILPTKEKIDAHMQRFFGQVPDEVAQLVQEQEA